MSSDQRSAIDVFISYSHRDGDLRDELEKHLKRLTREGVIRVWHDRRISAGQEWEGQIDEHLDSADLVLLLLSSDFLASDYCFDVEMTRALERHEAGQARVIPIVLRVTSILVPNCPDLFHDWVFPHDSGLHELNGCTNGSTVAGEEDSPGASWEAPGTVLSRERRKRSTSAPVVSAKTLPSTCPVTAV